MKHILCRIGRHAPPANGIVGAYGAIFLGGPCFRCDKMIQGEFLYNQWGEERRKNHTIVLSGINPQLVEDIKPGGYVYMGDLI